MFSLPILVLCIGACVALLVKPQTAVIVGCFAACLGSITMIPLFLLSRLGNGEFVLQTFFMLPIAILGTAAAIHSLGYLKGHGSERAGLYWFFFNLMLASMFCVTLLTSPIPFLLAWEMMGITSAALVAFDHKSGESMRAVWIYLAACQAGAACLILMFFAIGSAEVSDLTIFILALLGFGLKAGFTGLHVWLPEAHPAAPAPVSAIMSGAMINLGLYGILTFVPEGQGHFSNLSFEIMGWTFLVLGLTGSLLGILFALPQKNLKRLLAFSSIENMGIISLALGLFYLALERDMEETATLAFAGFLLHIVNHALLKGGLFLGAGSVFKATGTLNMDEMGGLMKRMPFTGALFTLNATGISGLPPFNGFISEFLIYLAAFQGIIHGSGTFLVGCLCSVIVLALVGGLAVAAFSKTIGAVFLGEPRSERVASSVDVPATMKGPVIALFTLSLIVSLTGPFVLQNWLVVSSEIAPSSVFQKLGIAFLLLYALVGLLLLIRFRLLPRSRENIPGPTWDCGYAKPTAKMEYTGTAFTQPLVDFFASVLHPLRLLNKPDSLFPASSSVEMTVEDAGIRFLWGPLFGRFSTTAKKMHAMQSGHLHSYILAMVAAVVAMLVWAMRVHPEFPAKSATGIISESATIQD